MVVLPGQAVPVEMGAGKVKIGACVMHALEHRPLVCQDVSCPPLRGLPSWLMLAGEMLVAMGCQCPTAFAVACRKGMDGALAV